MNRAMAYLKYLPVFIALLLAGPGSIREVFPQSAQDSRSLWKFWNLIPQEYLGANVIGLGTLVDVSHVDFRNKRKIPREFLGGKWKIVLDLTEPLRVPAESEKRMKPGCQMTIFSLVEPIAAERGTRVVFYAFVAESDHELRGDFTEEPVSQSAGEARALKQARSLIPDEFQTAAVIGIATVVDVSHISRYDGRKIGRESAGGKWKTVLDVSTPLWMSPSLRTKIQRAPRLTLFSVADQATHERGARVLFYANESPTDRELWGRFTVLVTTE